MKIAIIGNHDSILGFKALGVDAFAIENQGEAEKSLENIRSNKDYATVFITEDWMEKLEEKLKIFEGQALPAIVAIPNQQGTTGYGLRGLKRTVEQAVGSDILFKE